MSKTNSVSSLFLLRTLTKVSTLQLLLHLNHLEKCRNKFILRKKNVYPLMHYNALETLIKIVRPLAF